MIALRVARLACAWFDQMALFQRRRKRIPEAEQRLGLVVPPPARIIYDDKGKVIFDEIRVQEEQDRRRGRVLIEFDDSEAADSPPIMKDY
jgi:hypothetical protein